MMPLKDDSGKQTLIQKLNKLGRAVLGRKSKPNKDYVLPP